MSLTDPNSQSGVKTFQFGPSNSVYADYNYFAAGTPDNYTINDHPAAGVIFTLNNSDLRQIATVSGASPLTPCQCDYTRWGFWAVATSDSENNLTPGSSFGLSGQAGFWVAGRPVQISDVPITGTATYTGHVIADVSGAGIVAGNFSNAVDFGAHTGAVNVTGLDNTNYVGNVSLNGSSLSTITPLTGDFGGRNMALQGSFFQGKTSPVGEMGGSVAISGAGGYLGSGIFAAAKH